MGNINKCDIDVMSSNDCFMMAYQICNLKYEDWLKSNGMESVPDTLSDFTSFLSYKVEAMKSWLTLGFGKYPAK